jgi:hypothetical protein
MYREQEWTLGRVLTSAKKGKISEEEVAAFGKLILIQ